MQSELNELISLIQQFYSPTTPASLSLSLSHQLQSIQNSPLAWSFIAPLLSHPDNTVRFFAASTLETKLRSTSFNEIPFEQHESLKRSILEWLANSVRVAYGVGEMRREGEKVVLRKLAAAVTGLSFRLGESWRTWLEEVIVNVQNGVGTQEEGREAVLEVLTVVIEQIARADLSGTARSNYLTTLASSHPLVTSTLTSALSSPLSTNTTLSLSLTCLLSFLDAGQISHSDLSDLYPLILPHLSNENTMVAACALVEEIVERSSGVSADNSGVGRFIGRAKLQQLIEGWGISNWVRETVESALKEANEIGPDYEPSSSLLSLTRLLCAISEYHITSFLFVPPPSPFPHLLNLTSPTIQTLLQILLQITVLPGHSSEVYDLTEMTNGVWMTLQEESADIGLVCGSGEGREGRGTAREGEWAVLKGVFETLEEGIRRRAEWPSKKIVDEWPKDVRDGFKIYRSTVLSETLLYAYYVLRESMLEKLVQLAAQQVGRAQSSEIDQFEDLESTLFTLLTISPNITLTPSSSHSLSTLFSPVILGRLPSHSFPLLRSTTLRLIGAYSTFFATAPPEACLSAIEFVVRGLEELELGQEAARALRELCDANRRNLGRHVLTLVGVLENCQGNVGEEELGKVFEGVTSVVQALPMGEIAVPLLRLVDPLIAKLHLSVNNFALLPIESRNLCLQQLGFLTSCSKGLSDPDGDLIDLDRSFDDSHLQEDTARALLADPRIIEMRIRLGGAIESVARIWAKDIEVVQALFDFISSNLQALPSPLGLDDFSLLTIATSSLELEESASIWLSVSSALLGRLGREQLDEQGEKEQMSRVGGLMERGMGSMLARLGDLKAMEEQPDVVHAFLIYCSSIVRGYSQIFTRIPNYLRAIISFADLGLGMQERFSLKSTIDLLILIIQQTRMASSSSTIFRQTLVPHIPSILYSLLNGIAGAVPRSHLTSLSELLHALLLRLPEESKSALRTILGSLGWPDGNSVVSEEVKERFERAITSARTGKQARLAVSEFALVCRGLDGSAYGAASMAAMK